MSLAPPGPDGAAADRRRWLILAIVSLGSVMSALDVFIVNVAIPSLRDDLHAAPGQVELVVTVYSVVFALLLITGGRLGDLFGRTRVYLIGLTIFTLSSAACGAVPSPTLLIVFRATQAAGAAIMVPQAYAVVQRVFSPAERLRAISLLTTANSVGVVFAQVVGGALIQLNVLGLGWRIVFFVNMPIGVLGIVAGLIVLPRGRPERTSGLDLPGVFLGTATLLLLIVPLAEGRDLGWPPWLLVALAMAPVMAVVFVTQQRRRTAQRRFPLLELSLFRNRSFSAGVPLVALSQISNAGMYFVLALYLQEGRGLSPALAGLAFAPNALVYMCVAPFSPRIARRFGRLTILMGYLAIATALVSAIMVLHFVGPHGSPFDLMPSIALAGGGQGLVNSPLFSTVLSRTPRGHEGSASGFMTTAQQSGAAIGVAVEGLVFFSALGAAAAVTGRIPAAAASVAFGRALWLNLGFILLAAAMVRLLPARAGKTAGRDVVHDAGVPVIPASDGHA